MLVVDSLWEDTRTHGGVSIKPVSENVQLVANQYNVECVLPFVF